jgi:excisionase family DNA binding protein
MTFDPQKGDVTMPEAFFTAAGLADYLKVSAQTVRAWIRDGKVRAIKFGRSWRIPSDEVKRIVAAGIDEGQAQP